MLTFLFASYKIFLVRVFCALACCTLGNCPLCPPPSYTTAVIATVVANLLLLHVGIFYFHCSVLKADDTCPLDVVKSQQEKCHYYSFPDNFYKDSIDEICQSVSAFLTLYLL